MSSFKKKKMASLHTLLQKIDVKSLETKTIIQLFFLKSGEKVSMYQKYGYEYVLFSLSNFPGAAILNVYDVIWLLHWFIQKNVDH